jgi:hypothetical protein
VLHLDPAPSTVLRSDQASARLDAAYSNLFLFGSNGASSFEMDGEYLRTGLKLRLGLGGGFELGGELAAAATSGGFLDGFVIDYHDALGLPDQGRNTVANDQYEINARLGGADAFTVEQSGFEWLDTPFVLTWNLAEPDPAGERLGVALRGGIELPTGDDDAGYGNGGVDASVGALLEHRAFGTAFVGHVQHTFAKTPGQAARAGLEFRDVTAAGLSWEAPLDDWISALVQVEYETSTLRDLGVRVAARDQVLLWVGARAELADRWDVEFAFGEDLQGNVSPDFTAWVGVVFAPGRR